MQLLLTGNLGYVGAALIQHLRRYTPNAALTGFDTGYFAHCLTTIERMPEAGMDSQYFGNILDFDPSHLVGVDAVVHLAAVSNDPMGHMFEAATYDINFRASIRLAELARDAGVKHFVFASSCSIYGFAEGGPRRESDPINPLTAYARSKIATERALADMDTGSMVVTCLRFATACGKSDRLRLDLVLNDFVAGALVNREINVLSDGSPWRPLIDVQDMARAIEWAITRTETDGGRYLAVNAGSDGWNYQVCDLAEAVAREIPGTNVSINRHAPPDKRSYKVDFSLFRSLAPKHQPQVNLCESIRGLRDHLMALGFSDKNYRESDLIRLKVLERHMAAGRLAADLRWANH